MQTILRFVPIFLVGLCCELVALPTLVADSNNVINDDIISNWSVFSEDESNVPESVSILEVPLLHITETEFMPMYWTHWFKSNSNDLWTENLDSSDNEILSVSWQNGPKQKLYQIMSQNVTWYDSSRRRTIPARIFWPRTSGDEKCPVIIFSHGLGGSIENCSYLGSAWASRGFVVVLVQHPGSDENVWKGKIRVKSELQTAFNANWSGRTRANDIRFALNCIELLAEKGGNLGDKIDMSRIGVGGYDLGSLAALLVAGQLPPDRGPSLYDSRIKALLAMSPPINSPIGSYYSVYGQISVPTLFVTGTEDDGIVGTTKAHQRRIPFDYMADTDRYLITLQGADHRVYGGHTMPMRAENDKPFQDAIVRVSCYFWQSTLQNDEDAKNAIQGHRLNRILGGMARIERRLFEINAELTAQTKPDANSPHPIENSSPEANRELPLMTALTSPIIEKSLFESFPPTRFYRPLVQRYLEKMPEQMQLQLEE
ncbi:MAG: alpha/beta hydrolase family protein [Thermoguttaceae bacterium]